LRGRGERACALRLAIKGGCLCSHTQQPRDGARWVLCMEAALLLERFHKACASWSLLVAPDRRKA